MKQLIVALVGETGSGKSTFAAMCTEEEVHTIIAGINGKKGTTKNNKRMVYSKDIEFDITKFKQSYENRDSIFSMPLSSNIELNPFDALTLLDTQGLNDWKTDTEKEKVFNDVIKACDEADIIFIMIPEGGSVVTTNDILYKIFDQYCHKPIVFIGKAQQARVKYLGKESSIPQLKIDVQSNIDKYSNIYNKLGEIIINVPLPEYVGISPLLCMLPNSEELSSDIDAENRLSDNNDLKKCINDILQYAINLQKVLLDEMRDEYVKNNQTELQNVVNKLSSVSYIANNLVNVTGRPLCRPYVRNSKYKVTTDIEYSWQGGTPWVYPVCGGDYTYAANDVYTNIKKMIHNLSASVKVKSSLLSVLEYISEDRWTPGTSNLQYYSFTRGIPVKWILDYRTNLYKNHPNLFRDVSKNDFETNPQWDYLRKTSSMFKNDHNDWDKYMDKFYYFSDEQQELIKNKFSHNVWSSTVMIKLIIACIITRIDFVGKLSNSLVEEFWKKAFNDNGNCKVWDITVDNQPL